MISWLTRPLFSDSFLRVWMVIAAGAVLVVALVLAFVLLRRKKRKKRAKAQMDEPATGQPAVLPTLEIANLQGIGHREEQQDAFGISRLDHYDEDGLLAVLCDGMGGMAEGGMIAKNTSSEMIGTFPWKDDSAVPE